MSGSEFNLSIKTWLSGDGNHYKVLMLSRFGHTYTVWVQDYRLNDNPCSSYDSYYIEDGDAALHETFSTLDEAMDVSCFIVGHYNMNFIESSMGSRNSLNL